MKKRVLIALLASLSFSACTSTGLSSPQSYVKPTQAKMNKFSPIMKKVALSTREDARYKKMDIKPQDKEWFKMLMYRLWDRQITKTHFVTQGLSRYPKNHYEFSFIANGFQRF